MRQVFISYAHEDRDRIQIIRAALDKEEVSYWLDEEINPAQQWNAEIEKALEEVACVIVIWTKTSVNSVNNKFVHEEALWAQTNGKLLQLRLDFTSFPIGFQLDTGVDLYDWAGDITDPDWQKVMRHVRNRIENEAALDPIRREGPWAESLELLREFNTRFAESYLREVGRETGPGEGFARTLPSLPPEEPGKEVGQIFRTSHWDGQRYFVDALRNERDTAVRVDVLNALQNMEDVREPMGVWVIGVAGSGKTTMLHRIFFELIAEQLRSRDNPVPLLIEPRLLENSQFIGRLKGATDPHILLRSLFEIWLQHRGYEEDISRHVRRLMEATRKGKIIPLVDGYDELARLPLQTTLFGALRIHGKEQPLRYIIASRPEAVEVDRLSDKQIEMAPSWMLKDTSNYIRERFADESQEMRDKSERLLTHIWENRNADWLRNPRCVIMLVNAMTQDEDFSDQFFESAGGEYVLLKQITDFAFRRAEQYLSGYKVSHQELQHYLEGVARSCASLGIHEEERTNKCWRVARRMGDLLQHNDTFSDTDPADDDRPGTVRVRFINPNFLDFFLSGPVAETIRERGVLEDSYRHKWSQSLIEYVATDLLSTPQYDPLFDIRRFLKLYRYTTQPDDWRRSPPPAEDKPGLVHGANLMQLAVRLMRSGDRAVRIDADEGWRDLSNLYLGQCDFTNVHFAGCDLSGSVLSRSSLRKAVFDGCDMTAANLRAANAAGAKFMKCRFDFATAARTVADSPVRQLLIEDVELEDTPGYDRQVFLNWGARQYETRYRGPFSTFFFEHVALFTGGTTKEATTDYVDRIKAFLAASDEAEPCYLVDLMAGGSNPQLRTVLLDESFSNLRVLAIDRDTTQLAEFVEKFDQSSEKARLRTLRAIQHVIDGRLELETRLRNAFEEDRVDDADIIIGKKAFHEVQPATQRLLLQECAENLRPGGRLVVYADSPPFMGPQRMYDFETCRNNLMRATKELSSAGPEERDSIISVLRHYFLEEITLGPNDHDYGFFANLWVMLKDWCNDNGNELENRYFSSHTEIQDWAETLPSGRPTGLRLLNPNPQQYYYHLFAERFNERAINRLFEYIDGIRPNTPDPAVLDDLWRPSDMYELFRDFTATHLWPEGKKSAFGAHAGAVKDTVSLADFDKTLARFDFDAVGFKFPVHVLEFEKT